MCHCQQMWPALWIAWVCRMLISQTSQSGARLQTASQREHERRALTVRAGLPGRRSGALVRQPRGPEKDRLCIPSLHNGSVEEKEGVEVTSDHHEGKNPVFVAGDLDPPYATPMGTIGIGGWRHGVTLRADAQCYSLRFSLNNEAGRFIVVIACAVAERLQGTMVSFVFSPF
ncbi:hypothetical protein SKAU_G00215240 [Synaphobranchus kaupii]|uniref:Secreted protein n=1 Tax=Synaphobranchus kaupii TaxID=118154 RepID=A0A9Q1IUG2_SYNKA|nr:hypothetical protein SKAU_G00215240 [Synaphobranchus kaupii]